MLSQRATTPSQSQSSAWQSASGQEAFYGGQPYPKMDQVPPNKPLLKSLGATGTAIFGGIITNEEYNEDFYWKDAVALYEQMVRNDAQIFAVTQLLELPIRRATWSIEPASDDPHDKEIAAFVETSLFHDMRYETSSGRVLTQKWDDILRHILMMLRFGFMPFEVVWRIEDGWVKWARWTPLLPRTIWRWWIGQDNELVGVQQWTFKDYTYQFVDIPADKLLLFVHRQEGNNYEGVSVLRSAYKHWYYKDNYYKIEAIDIERNSVAIPVLYLPENFTDTDVANAQTIMANMRANEQMGVTLPPGWQIEYIRNMQRTTAQVQPSIQHHDVMIARNVLGQFLNLGSTEVGAYNLNASQMAMFLAALQAECEYIEDVINADAIPKLVDYNFDGVENYPRLKCGKLRSQDMDWLAGALNKLANIPNNPLVHSDAELEDYIRNELGLPQAPTSEVEGTNPSASSTPERPENDRSDDHSDTESRNVVSGSTAPNGDAESGDASTDAGAQSADGDDAASSAPGSTQARESAVMIQEARLLREALEAVWTR